MIDSYISNLIIPPGLVYYIWYKLHYTDTVTDWIGPNELRDTSKLLTLDLRPELFVDIPLIEVKLKHLKPEWAAIYMNQRLIF